jgi:hypothetical protein
MKGNDSIDCRFSNNGLTSAVAAIAGRVLQLDAPDALPATDIAPSGGKPLTRAAYDQVKVGVRSREVQELLGIPEDLGQQRMTDGRQSTTSWRYVFKETSIVVHFVNDQVADKESRNLPP